MTNPRNHPNRNWRTRMHAACAEWLMRWDWRGQLGMHAMTEDQLREVMAQSYRAGYEDGRAQARPPPRRPSHERI